MTLQEAKDKIAREYGYADWWSVDFTNVSEEVMRDEVAIELAQQSEDQNECNLRRFNQIIAEKDLQIGSQEVEIRDLKNTHNEQKADLLAMIEGLKRECNYLNNQSIAIDKIIFSEDLSIFEKVQEIQKLLL